MTPTEHAERAVREWFDRYRGSLEEARTELVDIVAAEVRAAVEEAQESEDAVEPVDP